MVTDFLSTTQIKQDQQKAQKQTTLNSIQSLYEKEILINEKSRVNDQMRNIKNQLGDRYRAVIRMEKKQADDEEYVKRSKARRQMDEEKVRVLLTTNLFWLTGKLITLNASIYRRSRLSLTNTLRNNGRCSLRSESFKRKTPAKNSQQNS